MITHSLTRTLFPNNGTITLHRFMFAFRGPVSKSFEPVTLNAIFDKYFMFSYIGMSIITKMMLYLINPFLTNGFSYCYHLGESTFIFRVIRSEFKILFNFWMKIL